MTDEIVYIARESGEVRARRLLLIVGGWFAVVFVILGVLLYINGLQPRLSPPPGSETYPAPRLVAHPYSELPSYLEAQKDKLAASTGSHLSIKQAMQAIAKRDDPYAPLIPWKTAQ